MLDIKFIRENPDAVRENIKKKFQDAKLPLVDEVLDLDSKRRAAIAEADQLRSNRNTLSKQIGMLMGQAKKDPAKLAEAEAVKQQVKEQADRLAELEKQETELEEKLHHNMLLIPQMIDSSVPIGKDDSENVEQRRWGEPRHFEWEPKAHWDIGTDLGILDFDTAASVTGARFTFLRGLGARLERSVYNFMLNTHTEENGYREVFPPYIVHERSMYGTGQLPKFKEDMFHLENTDYYLIPTAEVPVTNMYREKIIDGAELPLKFCAYSACFRAEAGSAGRDTRGLVRQHQFNKVELVKFVEPQSSYDELEALLADAESILQKLALPYRVVTLCAGDIGFSSAKTYDIEVWLPSYGRYVEISSCSNFEDFQARRANIRYKTSDGKPAFVHTLNGSGLAVALSPPFLRIISRLTVLSECRRLSFPIWGRILLNKWTYGLSSLTISC